MPTSPYMVNGDIWVGSDGTQRWTASLAEEVSQRLQAKYGLFLGEWFLDRRAGVPYYRDVLVRAPNMAVVRSQLLKVASDDPGVESVTSFDMVLDSSTRQLSVTLAVQLTDGEVLELEPFIV